MELDIHNYYETLVKRAIRQQALHLKLDEGQLTDLICLALNQLPARYIRYRVDMAGFASDEELTAMENAVKDALVKARAFLADHPRPEH